MQPSASEEPRAPGDRGWARVPLGGVCVLLALVSALALDVLSWWGRAAWLATALLGAGLVTAPWRPRERRGGVATAGAVLWAGLLVVRLLVGGESPHAHAVTMPGPRGTRLVDRVFEERDAAILGARLLTLTSTRTAPEMPTFVPLLVDGYARMESSLGTTMGSMVLSTYLGRDHGGEFGAFVIEPEEGEARGSVVFLHGLAGNFLLYCWEVAQAARASGLRTICPSTDWTGHWSNDAGERIARAALAYARRDTHTVLVGLSAGGVGASRLAPRLGGLIDGLVLVSGADPDAEDPGVPTLLLHGTRDGMMPVAQARDYRAAHASRATLVELDGTHFVLLEQRDALADALTAFLRAR